MKCRYLTVLNRECGRDTSTRLQWTEVRPATGATSTHDVPLCPFHHDLTLAELVLDCTVDAIITPKEAAA